MKMHPRNGLKNELEIRITCSTYISVGHHYCPLQGCACRQNVFHNNYYLDAKNYHCFNACRIPGTLCQYHTQDHKSNSEKHDKQAH